MVSAEGYPEQQQPDPSCCSGSKLLQKQQVTSVWVQEDVELGGDCSRSGWHRAGCKLLRDRRAVEKRVRMGLCLLPSPRLFLLHELPCVPFLYVEK